MFTDLRLALDDDDILATAGEEVEKLAEGVVVVAGVYQFAQAELIVDGQRVLVGGLEEQLARDAPIGGSHPRTLGHLLYQPAVGQGQPDGHVVVLTAGELHGQPPLLLHEGVGGDGRAGERAEVDMVGSGVCPAGESDGLPDTGAELPVARHLQGGNLVAVALSLRSHKGSAVGSRTEGMTLFGGGITLIEDCLLALQFTVGRQRSLYADLCPGFAHLLQVDPLAWCAFLDDPGLFGIEVRRQHVEVTVG